jgi:hypothetical protein
VRVTASAKDYTPREIPLAAFDTAATIQLYIDNNDFHLGLRGWDVSGAAGHVRVAPHSESSKPMSEIPGSQTARRGAVPVPPPPPMLTGQRYGVGPADEGAADAAFNAFRATVRALAAAEDAVGLAALSERPDVLATAVSGPDGWKALRETLAFGALSTSSRGAVAGRREYCSPSFYAVAWKEAVDAVSQRGEPWIVLGRDVPARAAAMSDAESFGTLEYDIIPVTGNVAPPNGEPRWREVVVPDGRRAWVEAAQLRSLADYHICFANVGGRWFVSAFDKSYRFQ